MKVSIITVVYNNTKTILDAINSVNAQNYKNIEYIIIDGNSTDGTLDIIKQHSNKITTIISEPDNGIYDAMNKGIRQATGDVIGILNSDDIYADEKVILDVANLFISNKNLDIVYGNLVYVKAEDTNHIVRNWISKAYFKKYFEWGNVPPHPTLFLKNSVYNKVGLFNLEFKLAADYEFMLRLFKKFDFNSQYLNRLMVKMRLGGATNKNLKNITNGNKEIIKAWVCNNLNPPFLLMPLRLFKRLIQFL